jgi:hypothetical protein
MDLIRNLIYNYNHDSRRRRKLSMALIICPECGKEISDKLQSCIHCGCPLDKSSGTEKQAHSDMYKIKLIDCNGSMVKALTTIKKYCACDLLTAKEKISDLPAVVCEKHNLYLITAFAQELLDGGIIFEVYQNDKIIDMELEAYDKKSDHTHIINNDHSDGRAIFKKCPKCGRFYNGGEYYCNCCHVKLEIIEENKKSSVQYKDETHIPKCPTCGSTDIKKISGISKATSVALWGILSQKVKKQWHCNNCSSEW